MNNANHSTDKRTPNITIAITISLLVIVVIISFLLAWGKPWRRLLPDNGYRYVIGVSQLNLVSSREIALQKEILNATDATLDYNVIFYNAGGDTDTQKEQLDILISQKVDVLIVDTEAIAELSTNLTAMEDAKIPLILIGDQSMSGTKCNVLLVNDYAAMGEMAADFFESTTNDILDILELQSTPNSNRTNMTKDGFRKGLNEHSQISYVVAGYNSDTTTKQRLVDSFEGSGQPNVNAIFAHDPEMAMAASSILPDIPTACIAHAKDILTSYSPDALIFAFAGGQEAVNYAIEILEYGMKEPVELILPIELIVTDKGGAK